VFSGIVGNEDFLETVHHPSAGVLGIIVSIYNLGCFSGTIVSFLLTDRLGPRKSMWFAMVWIIVCPSTSSLIIGTSHLDTS
jgi:MFS family permease